MFNLKLHKILIIILIILLYFKIYNQDLGNHIKENAIEIVRIDSLNRDVYEKLSKLKLIMVGEMHGTNEPAEFATALAELFSRNNETVQFGFEISPEQMAIYLQSPTKENVLKADFFNKKSNDGRASTAWANGIIKLTQNPKVNIFFFDIDANDKNQNRDSLMYIKIKNQILKYPEHKIITLSGNVHNKRNPHKGIQTMAYLLINDKELNYLENICTINHIFSNGTMLNNIGNGLELRQISNPVSIFSETVNYRNYLYLFETPNNYNGIFYTTTVSSSEQTFKKNKK